MRKQILVLGGAHLDRRGRISGGTAMGASNPGSWIEEIGGGAFNVARNLARLGHDVTMVSPRGGDPTAGAVAQAAEAAGVVDRPFVFLDRATPSYTAVLERDGNLVIALADMDLYRFFSPRRLRVRTLREAIAAADMIVCDANLPAETLTALAVQAKQAGVPVAGIAISPAKVVRFRGAMLDLAWLFMNAAEAAALSGERVAAVQEWPGIFRERKLEAAVITNGGRPLAAYSQGETCTLTPPPLAEVADVTGAGDALAAGTIDALLRGLPLENAVTRGIAASRITLRSPHAVAPDLSLEALEQEAALVGTPEKVL
ncbi:sugar/nucleoside kinase (ribokinase family) [Pseudorhizobium tarimense]|uniref:Sugar/nucleoside kinase (Ribokinase family) n=1 Tax=Pseudorhizobium tarimense TaxID=1079109 RepID=A0ABV2H2V0_9HYPH|nr:carbohydrate kinase family protein [Pseudorhizobium tarimense]MCJ8518180.1 carbohydrate kinase family protein [Pseudorhizobium tarimense]